MENSTKTVPATILLSTSRLMQNNRSLVMHLTVIKCFSFRGGGALMRISVPVAAGPYNVRRHGVWRMSKAMQLNFVSTDDRCRR